MTRDAAPMPDDRTPDDLELAYRRAVEHTADDAPRPAPRVRAAVLAAAQAEAARVRSEPAPAAAPASGGAGLPLPGAGRAPAANRPSWRLRAGALAAVVAVAGVSALQWRGHAARDEGATRVASADAAAPAAAPAQAIIEARVLPAQAVPPPGDLPPPRNAAPPLQPKLSTPPQAALAKAAPPAADAARARAPETPRDTPTRLAGRAEPRDFRVQSAPRPAGDSVTIASVDAPAAPTAAAPAPPMAAPAPVAEAAAPVPGRANFALDARGAVAASAKVATARTDAPEPPLHQAADAGDLPALRRLLAGPGASVDVPDAGGRTALLHAVLAGRAEAAGALLAAGADPGHADAAGLTPAAAAQRSGDPALLALFPAR